MKVTVKAPGSCGELAQGTMDGKNFLITCPIDVYSTITVSTDGYTPFHIGSKMQTAINKTTEYLQLKKKKFHVHVASDLPMGKGMASSSADISAICQTIALSAGKLLTADEIANIALSIEPTDGIFYPGIMLFDHIQGSIRHYLGNALPMYIAIFDVGGEINTLHFNQRRDLKKLNQANESQLRKAIDLIVKGLALKDISLIGQGATISALANQKILFKPHLEKIIDISLSLGAVGVNIAHSGTVVGVLFSPHTLHNSATCIKKINTDCAGVTYLRTVQFISGGLMKQEGEHNEWKQCR